MFVCRACMRKGLGVLRNTREVEARLLSSLRAVPSHAPRRLAFATDTSPVEHVGNESALPPRTRHVDESEDSPDMKRLDWVVNKHLQYLKDPFDIAAHIKKTLEKNRYHEALHLTRKASRTTKLTVGWNHLIDYQMKEQRLHAAIKLYNEMKKRAQLPDATTYTIIFRGCAASIHPKLAVSESLRIYQSMISVGKIKPNTIHMNAVLDVCSRAGDIESLFTVIKTATPGLRTPNNQTYTIIMNALRYNAEQHAWAHKDMSKKEIWDYSKVAISRARGVWEEVVERWRKGRVNIDEELVCATGRVLMMGERADALSVFELLEQTMQLPLPDHVKAPASRPKPTEPPQTEAGTAEATTSEALTVEASTVEVQSTATATTLITTTPTTITSIPESPVKVKSQQSPPPTARQLSRRCSSASFTIYAKPGNNTLSLILSILVKTRITTLAPKYWALLTQTHGVVPDKDNYICYLKALVHGRASAKIADAIAEIPTAMLSPMTFRLGFSACIRDELNWNAFDNAKRIFRVMASRLRYPDPHAMRLFLVSARGNFGRFREESETKPVESRLALGKQIVTALDMMWGPFRILCTSFSFPKDNTRSPVDAYLRTKDFREEMLTCANRMIAAYDKVIFANLIADEQVRKVIYVRRAILGRLVQRYSKIDEKMEKKILEEQRAGDEEPLGEEGQAEKECSGGNGEKKITKSIVIVKKPERKNALPERL
ncbi:hypothetical protein B0H66DRAFT_361018 [Apodospora peruviana]|uniref:Pentatricopeptide repeat protein n=1 Tax=Apodospora peruviana TaxID=516989 RepID=A0AAE0HVQ0_9PEZI|nr:hypothetical protein B0H66DRAFT_361018 [Apodospora peruviana]